ncbi:MAG: PBSX family phage terminase large subunit [Sarcina sp.]
MNQKRISDLINDNFIDFWKATNSDKYLKYVLKGGRASAKSTHIAFRIIFDMMRYPITTLCIRKVGNTLSDSVVEQLKEAIELMGVDSFWRFQKSPLQLIYVPRGNRIIFRGADDPAKIKSIKASKYPLTTLWVEEAAEFKSEDDISVIENSVLRAELNDGIRYKIYYSYNPPKRKQSWVNKKFETHDLASNVFVHHSTYLDNPYISKAFIEEANEVKRKNEYKYRWEYLGEPIGSGVVPFSNLSFRTITDEEYKTFDNIRQGLDFGYATDPLAFVRLHYDKTRRKIYFMDEKYAVKMFNGEFADWMVKKGYHTLLTTADSAEPKSIAELKSMGLKIKGAKKGAGSIEFGETWLDSLEEIVIDPKRTPNTAREFESIDYKTDKDGNVIPKLEETNNHAIDGTRYSMEADMVRKGVII